MGATQSQMSEDEGVDYQPQRRTPGEGVAENKSREYRGRAGGVAAEERPRENLPYNYEAILREADSRVHRYPPENLHAQPRDGVFLNHKKKKYSEDKQSNSNCVVLFARDLRITWSEDQRMWRWQYLTEGPGSESTEVAELLAVCWLEVLGKVQTANLTPGVLYEAAFVIMLKDPAYGWDIPVNLRLELPTGERRERKESLHLQPRYRWVEIPVGEFMASSENLGELSISLFEYEAGVWRKGLIIKGITLRPKNHVRKTK